MKTRWDWRAASWAWTTREVPDGEAEVTACHRSWLAFAALSLTGGAVLFVPRMRRGERVT